MNYPILRLTDWMEFILGTAGGQFLLAGYHTWETGFEGVFSRFWDRLRPSNETHDVYTIKTAEERARTIPMCIHGDEGRGLAKVPVLITNFQCVVPWLGEDHLNTHGLLRDESFYFIIIYASIKQEMTHQLSISSSIKGTPTARGFCIPSCLGPVMPRTTKRSMDCTRQSQLSSLSSSNEESPWR